jgi:short-subunit dehydrogenase
MDATLITGASGGIGLEYARIAAAAGENLILVARSKDTLERIASELSAAHGVQVEVIAEDLATDGAVERIVTALESKSIIVHDLVNNAGVGKLDPFVDMPVDAIENMLALNIRTVTMLTRALLPDMVAHGRGRILNVASTAAFAPGPLMAVYYASKAYVLSWSVALSDELRGTGVTVTCLCPGPTRTAFQKTAGMNGSAMFKKGLIMTAAEVALIGRRALLRGNPIVVAGWKNGLSTYATRLIPRTLAARIARRLQESTVRPA